MVTRVRFAMLAALLVCLVFSGTALAAQWAKTYGGTGNDAGFVYPATNGNFYLYGLTNSYGTGNEAGLFAKLTSAGAVSWAKRFGGVVADDSIMVTDLQNGSFFASGSTYSYGTGNPGTPNQNIFFAKYTSTWTPVFQKVFGAARDETGSFDQTSDGGFLFLGSSNSYGASANDDDILIFKISSAGALQWKKVYHYGNQDGSPSAEELSDGFLLSATMGTENPMISKTLIMKISKTTGAVIWKKMLSTAADSLSSGGFFETMDGNYILAGSLTPPASMTNPLPTPKVLLVKINPATGNILWSKTFGNSNVGASAFPVIENPDGSIILSGNLTKFDQTNFSMTSSILLMKISPTGAIQLQKKLGGGTNMGSISKTPAGEILLSGSHAATATSPYDALYGKLSPTTFNPIWVKTFGGAGHDFGIFYKAGTRYMLTGNTHSLGGATAAKGNIFGMIPDANGNYPGCSYVKPLTMSTGNPGLTMAAVALTQTSPTLASRAISSSPVNMSLPVQAVTLTSKNICPPIAGPALEPGSQEADVPDPESSEEAASEAE